MKKNNRFIAAAIGSLPHADAKTACQFIMSNFKEMPFWPQLPKRSFMENMYVQYSSELPGLVVDEPNKRIYIRRDGDITDKIEKVYEKYLQDNPNDFAMAENCAKGFYEFIRTFKKNKTDRLKYVKGQITGPVSFGMTVTDDHKRPIFYDRELSEVLVKVLSMKARWQIRKLRALNDGVVIFIDEPYLVSIGSSYVNINIEEATNKIDELINVIHSEGALCGIHCCGNTDWSFILKKDIDILSFDAYNFSDSLLLYKEALIKYLQRGGLLAWGIVPTASPIIDLDEQALVKKFFGIMDEFKARGIDIKSSMEFITPSCGCGNMSVEESEVVMQRANRVAESLNEMIDKMA